MKKSVPVMMIFVFSLALCAQGQLVAPRIFGGECHGTISKKQTGQIDIGENMFFGYRSGTNPTAGQYSNARHNTAFGPYALDVLTTGMGNSAFGYHSLAANTTGYGNTALGDACLYLNTVGSANTAIGYECLMYNLTGGNNIGIGSYALHEQKHSTGNICIGTNSGYAQYPNVIIDTTSCKVGAYTIPDNCSWSGAGNIPLIIYITVVGAADTYGTLTVVGDNSTHSNATEDITITNGATSLNPYWKVTSLTGSGWITNGGADQIRIMYYPQEEGNTAIGYYSMADNNRGLRNVAIGSQTLRTSITGYNNVAIVHQAMKGGSYVTNFKNYPAFNNVAIGTQSMLAVLNSASGNVFVGGSTGLGLTTGSSNTGIGSNALLSLTTGGANTAIGESAGRSVTGQNNVYVGRRAGYTATSGSYNIVIGYRGQVPTVDGSNQLNIGNLIFGTGLYGTDADSSVAVTAGKIGIGTNSPAAILDVTSTTSAFLPPRMTTAQRDAIATPSAGMMVYDTTVNKLSIYTSSWIYLAAE